MLKDCDVYGDSFTLAASAAALSEVFAEVGRQHAGFTPLSELDCLQVDEKYLYAAQEPGATEQIPWCVQTHTHTHLTRPYQVAKAAQLCGVL